MKNPLLFVTQQLPYPLTDGGNIRTFKILESLAAQFDICLIGSVPGGVVSQEGMRLLQGLCAEVVCVPDVKSKSLGFKLRVLLRSVLQKLPLAMAYNFNPHIHREVNQRLVQGKFWGIHINHLDTAQYFSLPRQTEIASLDSHNLLYVFYALAAEVESSFLKRIWLRSESERTRKYELNIFKQVNRVLVCSQVEIARLQKQGLSKNVKVVPNGVDCEYFHPPKQGYESNPPILVFTGTMGYAPNADAARYFIHEAMPLLRSRILGIRFVVVGRDPPEDLQALGRQWPDVTVTGKVPDVREFVWGAKIFVIPIRQGAGTRLKVLEAFAMGIPAISTSIGAEGIDFKVNQELLLAENAKDMVESIVALLQDPVRYQALGKKAMALAHSRYDWKSITSEMMTWYGTA